MADNLANLMGMAAAAEAGGNRAEAISYYNRVLELDPTISAAWAGKGRNAGWLSSLAELRVRETIVDFGHAIATVSDEAKPETARLARADLVAIAQGVYAMAWQHLQQFPRTASVRQRYLLVTTGLIDPLRETEAWDPGNRAALDLLVLMCRQLLDFGTTDPLKAMLIERMASANAAIAAIDPGYQPPALAGRTVLEKERAKADFDNLGYIVAFAMLILAIVVGAFVQAS